MQKIKLYKHFALALLISLLSVAVVTISVQNLTFLKLIEYWEDDMRIATLLPAEQQHPQIVVVTVTEETLAQFPYRSPIDRAFVSELLLDLQSKGASAIFLDFLFDQPTEPEKDRLLKTTIDHLTTPLVISYGDNTQGVNLNEEQQAYLNGYINPGVRGLANVGKDQMGTVRWIYPGHEDENGAFMHSVTNAMAIKLGKPESVNVSQLNRIAWHGAPNAESLAFKTYPAHIVRLLPAEWFKDKTVLIGSVLNITDRHRTPFSVAPELNLDTTLSGTPGIIIHAHSLAHVLDHRKYPNLTLIQGLSVAFLMALIASVLAFTSTRFFLNMVIVVGLSMLFWLAAIVAYPFWGILVPMLVPTLSAVFSFLLSVLYVGRIEHMEKEYAQEETKVKSEFLANMSHEIRSPMNAIMGMTQLVLESRIDAFQRKHLNTVLSSANALLNLINDILDLSKLESGKMKMESATFDLRQVLQDTVATLDVQAKAKGLDLELFVDEQLPNCYVGDPLRLRQVVMNLTNNAIKFTAQGHVHIKVTGQHDSYGKLLHFCIEDTGIGIPKHRQQAVFESFTQVDASTTRQHGGTGLGTTISKQIVELMEGEIWLESTEGEGSTFFFTARIPVAKGVQECQVEYGFNRSKQAFIQRSLKVLVVDDIEENLELCRVRLEQQHHRVSQVTDGQQALDAWRNQHFDVILMDAQMPVLDGFEATRQIRMAEKANRVETPVPIIAMTANAMKGDREKCLAVGMSDYVSKPIDFNELFMAIEKAVPKDAGIAIDNLIKETPNKELETSTEKNKDSLIYGVDFDSGLLVWGNEEAYSRSLVSFAKKHQQDGYVIKQSVVNSDFNSVSAVVHALKGVASNLSIKRLAEVAERIESQQDAPSELREKLIDNLTDELEKVTAAIQDYYQIEKADKPATTVMSVLPEQKRTLTDKGYELIQALMDELEAGDIGAAESVIEAISSLDEPNLDDEFVDLLADKMRDFDFDQALELIHQYIYFVDLDEEKG